MGDRTPASVSVSGVVSLDGDTIYVNGMTLANLIAAFIPLRGACAPWEVTITVEDRGAR